MDARSVEPADLVKILGSSEVVAKVTNGQLEISKEEADALGKFFNVDASLFLSK